MFRSVLTAGALLCALALSACNVTWSQVAGFVISAQTLASAAGQQQRVGAAQQRVVQACGFLPTAQTITAIYREGFRARHEGDARPR